MFSSGFKFCIMMRPPWSEQHNIQKHTPQKKTRLQILLCIHLGKQCQQRWFWKHTSEYLPLFSFFFFRFFTHPFFPNPWKPTTPRVGRFVGFSSTQEDFNMIFGARAKFSRYIGGISWGLLVVKSPCGVNPHGRCQVIRILLLLSKKIWKSTLIMQNISKYNANCTIQWMAKGVIVFKCKFI